MLLGARRQRLRLVCIAAGLFISAPAPVFGQAAEREQAALVEFFEKKVRPILANNCFNCHSANTNSQGGLRVDDRNGLVHGGKRGAAVVPGKSGKSLLIEAVRKSGKLKMPPEGQLNDAQIADLETWIDRGAAWPQEVAPLSPARTKAKYEQLKKEHWAWQPLREVKLPDVRDGSWAYADLDRFILAKLEQTKLAPVRDADPVTLIRRLTFDLTGLPPTPAEADAFVRAWDSASAKRQAVVADLVDRLLASPAFGERWGRHWLDIARYGESTGSARNLPYPHAWRYRDYVIDAFNKDKPYDRFIQEQIAGDLLPAASQQERDEQLIATGFLALGVKDVNQRFKVRFVMDNIDEMIDTVSRSVLALTASCARCHDHKFDPVPQSEYYALAGIFHSTDHCAGLRNKMGGGGLDYYDPSLFLLLGSSPTPTIDPKRMKEIEQLTLAVAEAKKAFEAIRGTEEGKKLGTDGRPLQAIAREKMDKLQLKLSALTDPAANGRAAMGMRDAKVVADTELRIRGEAEKLGPVIPRGFLSLIHVPDAPSITSKQSGRLELAQWLTSPKNPLTPRVLANRVWQHLFGQGLVTSVDNFGVTGDTPSHPELLDYLAARLIEDGWSMKKLVRTIVLSRTYQLSGEAPPSHVAVDPGNRLVWRHSPRRLDAEEIRDAALAAAGRLNPARPTGSPAMDLKVVELRNNGPEAARLTEETDKSLHRSVYLPLVRLITPRSLEVFDFATQGMVTGSRDSTTVAPQALYLLNDPFVRRQALALAERLLKRGDLDDAARIDLVYRWTVSRSASAKEIERARNYIAAYESDARKVIAATPPKVAATVKKGKGGNTQSDNPDDIDRTDRLAGDEVIHAPDARTAAWASFSQALLGSAEFRYVR